MGNIIRSFAKIIEFMVSEQESPGVVTDLAQEDKPDYRLETKTNESWRY
jgi:hypothetical protein